MSRSTLQDFLTGLNTRTAHRAALVKTIAGLATAAAQLAGAIADGSQNAAFADEGDVNVQGETQKHLDVLAHNLFLSAAQQAGVNCMLSEEEEAAVPLNPTGVLALAIDPLDGSSNIVINAPIGTIFGIYPVALGGNKFAVPEAGKRTFGSSIYRLWPAHRIGVVSRNMARSGLSWMATAARGCQPGTALIPASACEFAINASNHRHWSGKIRSFVNNCLDGKQGPYGADYNMRWLAALVGETHRILTRGGLFIYPADHRKGYEKGRLRYCYECAPISFLIENAGGRATDGHNRILDLTPQSLHGRVPFCFGSPEQVALFEAAIDGSKDQTSPLFSDRGFFRSRV